MRPLAAPSLALLLVLGSTALPGPPAAGAGEPAAPRYVVGVGGMH